MIVHYPIVLETEASGAVSAYVPGLPVYAAADSHTKAERAIRAVLTADLEAHPGSRSDAQVRVARFSDRQKTKVHIVGVAALVGARRSGAVGARPVTWFQLVKVRLTASAHECSRRLPRRSVVRRWRHSLPLTALAAGRG